MEGILVYSKEKHAYVLTDKEGLQQKLLKTGQQMSVLLCDVWVPVILQYSSRLGKWQFKYFPDVEVNGCQARISQLKAAGTAARSGSPVEDYVNVYRQNIFS